MKKNYWPLFFIGIFGFTFAMIVWTVYSATQVPVHKDDSFLSTYANVDEDFNKIVYSNIEFKKNYNINILLNDKPVDLNIDDIFYGQRVLEKKSNHKNLFVVGKNKLEIVITNINNEFEKDVKLDFKVSVPTNFNHDIILDSFENIDNKYLTEFDIPNTGNWNIMGKIMVKDNTGYLVLKSDANR